MKNTRIFGRKLVTIIFILGLSLMGTFGVTMAQSDEQISKIMTPDVPFTSVGLTWSENIPEDTEAEIWMKFLQHGVWTRWYLIPRDIDNKDELEYEDEQEGKQSGFLPTNRSTAYQYKIVTRRSGREIPTIAEMKVTTINADDGKKYKNSAIGLRSFISQITQDMISQDRLKIVTRGEWGADEDIRVYRGDKPEPPVIKLDTEYLEKFSDELQIVKKITTNEKGELLTWPIEYPEKISKIIVHHTASTANLQNPQKAIRDIYHWHANGRGWGDIGYNYIIDPGGVIYEGRAGGEKVIGAHAGKSNTGTIGISVMGNYETGEVSEKALIAVTRLISEKTKIHGIDPTGTSIFRGEHGPNILGHRDVMSTTCPGKNLYDRLPLVAKLAKSSIKTTVEEAGFTKQKNLGYDFEDTSGLLYIDLDPEKREDISISIKNTGTQIWSDQTSIVVDDLADIKDFIQVETPPGRVSFLMQQAKNVNPGETATYSIPLSGGLRSGLKTMRITPIINGKTKLAKKIEISVQTTPAIFTYEVVGIGSVPQAIKAGEKFTFLVEIKNTGNINWQNKGNKNVRMGTARSRDRLTSFLKKPAARAGFLEQDLVKPGETGKFIFDLIAPKNTSSYEEFFAPVVESVTWMSDKNIAFKTFIYEKNWSAAPISIVSVEAIPDSTQSATVKLRNLGGVTWTKENAPKLKKTGNSRLKVMASSLQESEVLPGQIGTFDVRILIPKIFKSGKIKLDAWNKGAKITTKVTTLNVKKTPTEKKSIFTLSTIPSEKSQTSSPSITTIGSSSQSQSKSKTSMAKGHLIRIHLGYAGTSPIISANGSFTVTAAAYSAIFSKDTKITIKPHSGGYELSAPNFSQIVTAPIRFTPDPGIIMRVDNWERRPSWDNTLNDNEFRGTLEITPDGIINELPLEEYMLGLAETPNMEPMEKKKAIVIAARTYAYYYTTLGKGKKFPGKPYDLDDDPDHSQKYLGYGYEKRSPNSTISVEQTAGTIIQYNGKVVITPYFSTSDGQTKSAQQLWGWQDAAYLPAVDDPYCKGMKQAGHGVGMSGCGALGMANNSKTYEEILKYYYKGVTIEKVY